MSHFAIQLAFGRDLTPELARAIGQILMQPAFGVLSRVSTTVDHRSSRHAKPSPELVAKYLVDRDIDTVSFDSGRKGELVASADFNVGKRYRDDEPASQRFHAYIVVQLDSSWPAVIAGVNELASLLGVAGGFVAAEPKYGRAHIIALAVFGPRTREGLSEQRVRERRARHWKKEQLPSKLGIEWGMWLAAPHLAVVPAATLRASGAFAVVTELAADLVYVQITNDPDDDLTGVLEQRLGPVRDVLAPLLLDISDVPAE